MGDETSPFAQPSEDPSLVEELIIEKELIENEHLLNYNKHYAICTNTTQADGQASILRNDSLEIINDSDPDWWLVHVDRSGQVGYVDSELIETSLERLARTNQYKNLRMLSAFSPDPKPKVPKTSKTVKFNPEVTTKQFHYSSRPSANLDSSSDYSSDSSDSSPEANLEDIFNKTGFNPDTSPSFRSYLLDDTQTSFSDDWATSFLSKDIPSIFELDNNIPDSSISASFNFYDSSSFLITKQKSLIPQTAIISDFVINLISATPPLNTLPPTQNITPTYILIFDEAIKFGLNLELDFSKLMQNKLTISSATKNLSSQNSNSNSPLNLVFHVHFNFDFNSPRALSPANSSTDQSNTSEDQRLSYYDSLNSTNFYNLDNIGLIKQIEKKHRTSLNSNNSIYFDSSDSESTISSPSDSPNPFSSPSDSSSLNSPLFPSDKSPLNSPLSPLSPSSTSNTFDGLPPSKSPNSSQVSFLSDTIIPNIEEKESLCKISLISTPHINSSTKSNHSGKLEISSLLLQHKNIVLPKLSSQSLTDLTKINTSLGSLSDNATNNSISSEKTIILKSNHQTNKNIKSNKLDLNTFLSVPNLPTNVSLDSNPSLQNIAIPNLQTSKLTKANKRLSVTLLSQPIPRIQTSSNKNSKPKSVSNQNIQKSLVEQTLPNLSSGSSNSTLGNDLSINTVPEYIDNYGYRNTNVYNDNYEYNGLEPLTSTESNAQVSQTTKKSILQNQPSNYKYVEVPLDCWIKLLNGRFINYDSEFENLLPPTIIPNNSNSTSKEYPISVTYLEIYHENLHNPPNSQKHDYSITNNKSSGLKTLSSDSELTLRDKNVYILKSNCSFSGKTNFDFLEKDIFDIELTYNQLTDTKTQAYIDVLMENAFGVGKKIRNLEIDLLKMATVLHDYL
ncbi:hypothetical protein BB558_002573 [Smittium angustum]|uniref:SH3 domain-containing protein n=1 Tax=Smittium angustum TaxID=133377 RepID=A0A2U1J8D3_SMIAN|nr:hypothetical protein BB558_002573 [Smittium angustum]